MTHEIFVVGDNAFGPPEIWPYICHIVSVNTQLKASLPPVLRNDYKQLTLVPATFFATFAGNGGGGKNTPQAYLEF